MDSKDVHYASFGHVLNDANHNDCMKYCTQVQHPDFVGVELEDFGSHIDCFCDFSGGFPGDVNANSYIPSATLSYSDSGVGPVESSDDSSGKSCYRYTPVSLFLVKLCLDVHRTIVFN
jgi:hypothetical protein